MNGTFTSRQATSIVRHLSALEDMMTVSVVSKRFPRLGPAEAGTGYRQEVNNFAPPDLPESFGLPEGTDEVVITFNGKLRAPKGKQQLIEEVSDFLGTTGYDVDWDFRALASAASKSEFESAFELTVFTNFFGPSQRDGAD